jgi:(2Fe-2S) ferredoxin
MDVEGQAPLVKIEQEGQPTVVYGHVTPEKLHEIFAKHVVGGEVVEEWVVAS